MTKVDSYAEKLKHLEDWEPFLLAESGLPGRRANLELAQAVANEGNKDLFERLASHTAAQAPANSPYEFLAFCGVLGLGQLLAEGDRSVLPDLRAHASDLRWRLREAVAMALQRWGRVGMAALLEAMREWCRGSLLEQRAALAALCEPDLLHNETHAGRVLDLLDEVTAALSASADRDREAFKILRKGLGYCWSVAVAALPSPGKEKMAKWYDSADKDVRWVMRENLKKKRLERMDRAWVQASKARLGK